MERAFEMFLESNITAIMGIGGDYDPFTRTSRRKPVSMDAGILGKSAMFTLSRR